MGETGYNFYYPGRTIQIKVNMSTVIQLPINQFQLWLCTHITLISLGLRRKNEKQFFFKTIYLVIFVELIWSFFLSLFVFFLTLVPVDYLTLVFVVSILKKLLLVHGKFISKQEEAISTFHCLMKLSLFIWANMKLRVVLNY